MRNGLIGTIALGILFAVFSCTPQGSPGEKKTAPGGSGKSAKGGGSKKAGFVLRINCAAEADYTDPAGHVWKADALYEDGKWGYMDGNTVLRTEIDDIEGTDRDPVYLNERWGLSEYRITAPNGTHTVVLHFAETYDGIFAVGDRVYDVTIEDKTVLPDFDPFEEAGGKSQKAIQKTFDVTLTDGVINIGFVTNIQSPMINGIEILQKP